MRSANIKPDRVQPSQPAARFDRVINDNTAALRNPGEPTAPEIVSRILASAVLDQFARDRNGVSGDELDGSPSTANGSLPSTAAMDSAASAAPTTAEVIAASDDATSEGIPLWKRIFDSAVVLLFAPLWVPLVLIIMLGIKCSSPGPIFYQQERIGFRGRRFMLYKFRTMKVNVETRVHESYFERLMEANVPMTKLDANGDPRLIRWGRFLRAAGLDELPQLFNVLRGEMSLVGPRPCTVHEFKRYLPYQRERVNAPPGLTGYWQVHGKNRTTFSEMIEMDIFYGKNMSVALDFWILCKTLPAIISDVKESRSINAWKQLSAVAHPSAQTSKT